MSARRERPASATVRCPDAVRQELEQRLFDSLDYYEGSPARVLDVGCGDGRATVRLRKRWRGAQAIGLDASLPKLRRARRAAGWWRPFARIRATAWELPFADRTLAVVYSNLCLPWGGEPRDVFHEFARVLQPGGVVVASSLGPDTLMELRAACIGAGVDPLHEPFPDMHDVGDAALASGLKDPVLDTDRITLEYPDVAALLADIRDFGGSGAVHPVTLDAVQARAIANAYPARTGSGRIQATFEVVTLHAWGFPEGAFPLYGGRETRFEVISRRVPRP